MKRRPRAMMVGAGLSCRSCGATMRRFEHPKGWRPKPSQPFYFIYWDVCSCGRIQHYEAAKTYTNAPGHGALNANQGRALAAVMERLPGRMHGECRKWIAVKLGIEEHQAVFSHFDESFWS